MRISRVETEHIHVPSEGAPPQEYRLYLLRTPAAVTVGGEETVTSGCNAVLYASGQSAEIRPTVSQKLMDRQLKCGYIAFKPSSADRQYLDTLGIPLGVPVAIADSAFVFAVLRGMKARMGTKKRAAAEFAELSLRLILLSLVSAEEAPVYGEDIPKYPQLKALRDSIYADPTAVWDIAGICRDIGISRTYFHRLYTEAFGVTCRQDVIESRLQMAERLLSETEMSVAEIAVKCGYDSESYFMRQFRLRRGCTPTDFRRRQILKDKNGG